MNLIRNLFALLVVAGVSACSGTLNPTVATPSQVAVAINAFDAAEITATNYLTLPLCATGGPKVCRTAPISTSITTAVRAGIAARNALTADLQTNASAPITALEALNAAVSTISTLAPKA